MVGESGRLLSLAGMTQPSLVVSVMGLIGCGITQNPEPKTHDLKHQAQSLLPWAMGLRT